MASANPFPRQASVDRPHPVEAIYEVAITTSISMERRIQRLILPFDLYEMSRFAQRDIHCQFQFGAQLIVVEQDPMSVNRDVENVPPTFANLNRYRSWNIVQRGAYFLLNTFDGIGRHKYPLQGH